MENHRVSAINLKPGERPFRSFKTRYLIYYLPIILMVSAFLTIVLVMVSHQKLLQQQQETLLRRFDLHGENLRMTVFGAQTNEVYAQLQEIAERLDLSAISLFDAQNVCVASFSAAIVPENQVEMNFPLSFQDANQDKNNWQVFVKAGKSSYASLIDSFMIYQLIILLFVTIGSVTATFLAFDSMVGEPLTALKRAIQGLLENNDESCLEPCENDELGSSFSLFNRLVERQKLEKRSFKEFCRQAGMVWCKFDPSGDTFLFPFVPDSFPGLNIGIIHTTGDLFAHVDSSQRGEVRQKWFDIKDRFAKETSGTAEIDLRLARPDEDTGGVNNDIWLQMVIFWNSLNGVAEISGILRDISQAHRREFELKNLANSFRQIYENSPIGIWRCVCQKDQYFYLNNSMARILGYNSPEEALEKITSISREVFYSPGERTFFLDEVKKRDQAVNLEMRFKRADGSVFWGAIFGRLYIEQNVQYCEGALFDISERKMLDERLRSNEEFLRQGLETSGLVLWQLEPVSGKLQFKGAVNEMFGPGMAEVTSLKILQRTIHPEDLAHFGSAIDKVRRGEGGYDKLPVEFRICRVDSGQKVAIRWLSFVAVRHEIVVEGRPGLVRGVFVDVTHQKEAEQKLSVAIAAALAESRHKSEFFAGVSHSVRTPLNAIIGFSELVMPMVENSRAESYVSSILSASRSLVNILNSMHDLSRLEAGKIEVLPEPVRMREMLADIRQSYIPEAEKRGLELKTFVDNNVPATLMLDDLRVRQIITNLLSNSLRFTSTGSININVSATMQKTSQSVDLLISVQDTGQGIHSDSLKELFKPLSEKRLRINTGSGGVGMGLVICHSLVELMGGKIKVKSEIQCGSRFDVTLRGIQLAGADIPPTKIQAARQHYNFNGQKILVADDTASNRELMAEAMRSAGLRVICASDGEEALRLAIEEQPELIFMDIRMPRKDGIVATRELKSIPALAKVPVVAVTASVNASEQKELITLFDSFVYKPVSLVRLFSEAARYLNQGIKKELTPEVGINLVMTPEAFEQMHEPWGLVESISRKFIPRLKELEELVVTDAAIRLAEELKALAVKHSFNHLTIEADKLSFYLEKLDQYGIDNSRKRIGQMFTQVLNVYSRKSAG